MLKAALVLCLVGIVPLASSVLVGNFTYSLVRVIPRTNDQVDFLKKSAIQQSANFGRAGSNDVPLFITPLAKRKPAFILAPIAGMKKFKEVMARQHIVFDRAEVSTILSANVDNSIHAASVQPSTRSNFRIESPRTTNWGVWGQWAECQPGQFVVGMRLKTEAWQGDSDDTALNAIRLLCAAPGSHSYNEIGSLEGPWGTWGRTFYCPHETQMNGFELRSEEYIESRDDTAGNNLRIFCGDNTMVEGDGRSFGDWTGRQYCLNGQSVCGFRTQIEPSQGSGDDTALNNVDMVCCDNNAALQINRGNNYNQIQQQQQQRQQQQQQRQQQQPQAWFRNFEQDQQNTDSNSSEDDQ